MDGYPGGTGDAGVRQGLAGLADQGIQNDLGTGASLPSQGPIDGVQLGNSDLKVNMQN
jgi:hypothetical protein